MKTYTCDRCGKEKKDRKGIVGREFERMGFETLAPCFRVKGIVDVCADCYGLLEDERKAAVQDKRNDISARVRGLLGMPIK